MVDLCLDQWESGRRVEKRVNNSEKSFNRVPMQTMTVIDVKIYEQTIRAAGAVAKVYLIVFHYSTILHVKYTLQVIN